MKKRSFVLILLCLLAAVIVSCGGQVSPDECKHRRLSETQHEPDCSLEGYIEHVCRDCGHTYKSDFVEPTGHKLTATVTAPTCTEEGYTEYTCDVCEYSYRTGFIEPTGHTLTSKITSQTCTKEGYTTYSCPCGYSYRTALVIPNGHNLTKTTVPPTCSADGYDRYKCNNCDYEYKTDFTAMSHDLTKAVIAPTCVKEGYTKYECDDCDYGYKTEYVAPTGHDCTPKTTAPTFNDPGYTVYTCRCGFSYIGDYVWHSNLFSGIDGNEKGAFSFGVDLSYHNETVDFEALAKDGVDFVILRVGYIRNDRANVDEKFEEYYAAARKAGLDIGAYIFTYKDNTDEMIDLTRQMLKSLEGKTFEYPIYLDIEPPQDRYGNEVDDDNDGILISNLSEDVLMDMCYEYCELLVQKGYYPGIYSGRNFIKYHMDPEKLSTRFELWGAHYLDEDDDFYADEYNMWQRTKEGSVDGVSGDVDKNVCYKDYPSIIKKYGYNGYTK